MPNHPPVRRWDRSNRSVLPGSDRFPATVVAPASEGAEVATAAEIDLRCALASEAPVISSTMTTVTVDGVTFGVRGKRNRLAFATELERCGASEAGDHFRRWRAARRSTNWMLIPVITLTVTPGGVPIPINLLIALGAASAAGGQRLAMEEAMAKELPRAFAISKEEFAQLDDGDENAASEP